MLAAVLTAWVRKAEQSVSMLLFGRALAGQAIEYAGLHPPFEELR